MQGEQSALQVLRHIMDLERHEDSEFELSGIVVFFWQVFLNQNQRFPSTAELNPDQNRGFQSAHSVGGLRLGCGSSLFGLNPFLVCVVVL